jgi:hypothetical protein
MEQVRLSPHAKAFNLLLACVQLVVAAALFSRYVYLLWRPAGMMPS